MHENYKHLYEQTKKMLTIYQDEIVPGFRKQIEELEKNQVNVRCKDCTNYHEFISGYRCVHFNGGDSRAYQTSPDDFCSYGERRTDHERE